MTTWTRDTCETNSVRVVLRRLDVLEENIFYDVVGMMAQIGIKL